MNRIINSALWAAYGDALGFITELVDRSGVYRRIGSNRVKTTVPWHRFVGGRFGAKVALPSGCYSDDTQLRLCTSRAIRGDGKFDVETFAKIEIPVWLSYSLGAGRGTKAAANSLARQDVNWFNNFFEQKYSNFIEAGGNGAAMRIQPHIWASNDRSEQRSFIKDVIRNAICTHGHSRGILGAVFHAMCLSETINKHNVPNPDFWFYAIDRFVEAGLIISDDPDLSTFWLPVWEEQTGISVNKAFEQVANECRNDLKIIEKYLSDTSEKAYKVIVSEIGGFDPKSRGSGTKTAILATVLCWMYRNEDPSKAIETASNLLSSDTDTIATMTGALLGVIANEPPVADILDREYIKKEAERLYRISQGESVETFLYPDLFKWSPPKTHQDAIGLVNGRMALAGLGIAESQGEPYKPRGKSNAVWQRFGLDFGQTIIGKRRLGPRKLPVGNLPVRDVSERIDVKPISQSKKKSVPSEQTALFNHERQNKKNLQTEIDKKTIDELTKDAINSNFDSTLIGQHILELSRGHSGIESSIGYVAIIAKAIIARLQPRKK